MTSDDISRIKTHIGDITAQYIEKRGFKESEIVINHWLLNAAIDSAVMDMERMSDFHIPNDSSPDSHKFAGFFSKWIAKLRPIQFIENLDASVGNNNKMWANSELALAIFNGFLRKKVPPELMQNLRYSFMYRDEKGEALALIAYCCEQIPSNEW